MTNGWVDIKNADVILAMGGNPAENHPVGFKWFMEARRQRGAKLVVVDPRFTRTAAVADLYAPIRPGTDIAFLLGVIRYALETKRYHEDYVKLHTNAGYVISDKYAFHDGLFSGFDAEKKEYARDSWAYAADETSQAYKLDADMQSERSVFQLLKAHVARYTPEIVERICGTPKDKFLQVAELVTSTGNAERVGTITYALGWTQHSTGVQIIRAAAMLQLLLGNVGRPGGGVNAFRGHSNIQGATDTAGNFEILPGYLKTPTGAQQTLAQYDEATTPTTLNKQAWSSMNYWTNTGKFMVSLLKAVWGAAATKDNDFGYAWLPKVDGNYSWLWMFDDMYRGSSQRAGGTEPAPEGLISFGMNPVGTGPSSKKMVAALAKLKWLVVVENAETETAQFWKAPAEYEPPPAAQIGTEVYLLPAANFAEKDGTFTNSARWLQWKWRATDPPGQARSDQEILARLVLAVRDLYAREGGTFPEPILNLSWSYANPAAPDLGEVLKEMNGKALADVYDEKDPTKLLRSAGQQLDGFAQLRDDGSTMCGNWLHSGVYTEAGNLAQRRSTADPTGLGMYHNWAFSWPANRRVLYNRAAADEKGIPWDAKRPGVRWTGQQWVGDVPDIKADSPPGTYGAFIMLPEGVARLFSPLNDGPFPEHYEAVEAPVPNLLHPAVSSNPVVKRFTSDKDHYGTPDQFPIVCTTYRLTEHFHYWTQHHGGRLGELQPGFFVEIPEALAKEKGIANGEMVTVRSARGEIHGVAMVTKRMPTLQIDGKQVWQIGFPIHWGFAGAHRATGQFAHGVRDGPEHLDARVQDVPGAAGEGARLVSGGGGERNGLEIRQRSAALRGEATGLRHLPVVSKFIDTSTCIGCKACEVACQEWNDLQVVKTTQTGSYQTMPTLHASFWNLIKFREEVHGGAANAGGTNGGTIDALAWLMRKDQCMHCADPGCLKACPAPGAIVQYENGIVDVNPDKCIGCGLCATGCPFDVPRFHEATGKMAKCTLCVDRVSVGIEPACVKACPTGCLQFGTKEDMVALGEERVAQLQASGHKQAALYDPPGVGGTTVITVLAHGDKPEWYGLPKDPEIPASVWVTRQLMRPLGLVAMAGSVGAAVGHFLKMGPKEPGAAIAEPAAAPALVLTPQPTVNDEEDVVVGEYLARHRLRSRVVHWLTALCFFGALCSGMPIWTPIFGWMAHAFGGLAVCRWLHPWLGVGFLASTFAMVGLWAHDMRMEKGDWGWFGPKALDYFRRKGKGDPDVGKYNGGQKLFFYLVAALAVVLFASGLVLWFPRELAAPLPGLSWVLHDAGFLLFVCAIVVHIYLGTAAMPGTFRSMTRGTVTKEWARLHHPRWAREVTGEPKRERDVAAEPKRDAAE